MKAKELRFGNYIKLPTCAEEQYNLPDKHAEVSAMTKNRIHFKTRGEVDGLVLHSAESYDEIEPITITEEWLLNLGFNSENRSAFLSGSETIYKIIYKGDFLYNEYQNNWYWNKQRINVEYVHQLQNLYFALTGTELTIKEE